MPGRTRSRFSYPVRRRTRRTSARRYRYVVLVGSGGVSPTSYGVWDLLSPTQPPSSIADSIYQQMTNPTIARIEGHVDVYASKTYALGTTYSGAVVPFAWGLYVDKDIQSNATALPPYSLGFTTTWLMHETGTVHVPGFLSDATRAAFIPTPIQHKRSLFNSKYKRKVDTFNDSLIFTIENASTTDSIAYDFYFRFLLLE